MKIHGAGVEHTASFFLLYFGGGGGRGEGLGGVVESITPSQVSSLEDSYLPEMMMGGGGGGGGAGTRITLTLVFSTEDDELQMHKT